MSSRKLYRTPIPGSSLRQSDDMTRPEVATLAGISSLPAVEKTGSQADEITLAGAYRGRYADRLGTELRELLDADALDAVPFYGVNDTPPDEAYVTADRAEGGRVAPVSDAAAQFRGRLVAQGTRATHRRAVHAAAQSSRQISHDFGNSVVGYIGVPSSATKVKWVSNDTTARTTATADQTVAAEFGDVALYDVETAPTSPDVTGRPYLVYDLPYADEGDVDAGVWDTYGVSSKTDADGIVAWQRVFAAAHEFRGVPVIETGRLRTTLDTAAGLTAERWDDGAGSWASVTLGTSDWVLDEVDLVRPGAAHVYAQLTFRATADTTDRSQGDLYPLDAYWHRGWDDVQFAIPEGESGPIPSDLVTLLDPVAADTVINPRPDRTLLSREDLRA